MRTLELAYIAFVVLAALMFFALPRKIMLFHYLANIGILCLVVTHLLFEGYRWQMIPAYILGSFVVYIILTRPQFSTLWSRVVISFFLIIWVPVAILLPIIVPIFTLPEPSGIYDVAKVSYHLKDPTRKEVATTDQTDTRELPVSIWYPTEDSSAALVPYVKMTPKVKEAIANHYQIPSFFLSYLSDVTTNSFTSGAVAESEQRFPVVLLSHGLPGNSSMMTSIAENLASNGFIVAAIDHTYYSNLTILPDDKVIFSTAALPNPLELEEWDNIISSVWMKDQQQALDFILNSLQYDPLFAGTLNVEKVGVLGHSFGGAAVFQTLLTDERIKAGVNMDGTFFGHVQEGADTKKPFLFMKVKEEQASLTLTPTQEELASLGLTLQQFNELNSKLENRKQIFSHYGGYEAVFTDLKHLSFNDFYMFSPILQIVDKVHVREDSSMINWLLVQFFNKTLYDMTETVFDTRDIPYSRLTITSLQSPNTP
ncbi:alpha/beta fold hydrolase [Bacillus sp. HMF5848]|uniref:alpha/beta hydrolase family protein n=1 Tax=Bacillus sp. HMF5848 TaxID=2495421 RepID=UPI000F778D3C|nr:alpha/beta fold hydrolase [Bacillus sp. HMF5848]RSK25786.1 alpha/beta fold hydrolase [Bacillus sp. HMF5848]